MDAEYAGSRSLDFVPFADIAPRHMNIMQGAHGQYLRTAGRPLICIPLDAQALVDLQGGNSPREPLTSPQLDDIPPILFQDSDQNATYTDCMDQLEPNAMSFGVNQTIFGEYVPL